MQSVETSTMPHYQQNQILISDMQSIVESDVQSNIPIVSASVQNSFFDPIDRQVKLQQSNIHLFRQQLCEFFSQHLDQKLVYQAKTDDRCCYYFLKARSMSVDKAVKMFKEALLYRESHDLDNILLKPFQLFDQLSRTSNQGYHKFDRYGRPVYIELVGLHNVNEMEKECTVDERIHYHLLKMEYQQQILLQEASVRFGRSIGQVVLIMDMTGIRRSIATKYFFNFVTSVMKLNTLLDPESLAHVFLINAPSFFKILYAMVSNLLDSQTRNKIHIHKDSAIQELTKYIKIDDLPIFLGGKCRCNPNESDSRKSCLRYSPQSKQLNDIVSKANAT